MNSKVFIEEMSKYGVYISSTSACSSSLNYSPILGEITNGNREISTTSIRVSISHFTTLEEIEKFIEVFDKISFIVA
jgi:cysteine desulfurase